MAGWAYGSDHEDELAPEVSVVEESVRVRDSVERERILHVHSEPTPFDEVDEFVIAFGDRGPRTSNALAQ